MSDETRPQRPLDGVLVLDFSTLLPGPLATLLLAEAGAEVVKVERPGTGEELRSYQPRWGGESATFALLNRGKKSLTADLKTAEGRARLDPLLRRADVLVEQFRPGVMDRLGLGYAAASALNPALVYCSITGYGQTGPKRDQAGHDLNYIADAGLLALSMGPPDRPSVPPALVADIGGGAYPAVMNILLALEQRRRTGCGCRLDVSMTDNLMPFAFWALASGQAAGRWPGNADAPLTGGTARYRIYPTRDGGHVAAAPLEQRFWEVFCDIIGLEPALRRDQDDPQATLRRASEIVAAETAQKWRGRFAGRDCCCTIVATLEQALADPQFQARGVFARSIVDAGGRTMPALPVPIDAAFRGPPGETLSAPRLGEHDEILRHAP